MMCYRNDMTSFCQSSSPTPSPTPSPSSSPSSSPTPSPSSSPSSSPTPLPTSSPTSLPTHAPLASPTPSPTASPTATPTPFPTHPLGDVDGDGDHDFRIEFASCDEPAQWLSSRQRKNCPGVVLRLRMEGCHPGTCEVTPPVCHCDGDCGACVCTCGDSSGLSG